MIEAKQNKLYLGFISWYSRLRMKLHFRSISIVGNYTNTDKPLLVVCNHFSWWDGFFVQFLNQKILGKNFYFMMLEEQLRKHMFLNQCGGFSVNEKPRELLKSLNHAAQLLGDKNNLVLIFPQGKIETKYKTSIRFERGIEEILKRSGREVQILFMANLIDYFSYARPSLTIYIKEAKTGNGIATLQNDYNKFFDQCISNQTE